MKKVRFKATKDLQVFSELRTNNYIRDGWFAEMTDDQSQRMRDRMPRNFIEVKAVPKNAKVVTWRDPPKPKRTHRDSDIANVVRTMVPALVRTLFEEMTSAAQTRAVKK